MGVVPGGSDYVSKRTYETVQRVVVDVQNAKVSKADIDAIAAAVASKIGKR